MVRKPLILTDFVREMAAFLSRQPGEIGFCHRRRTLDSRYVRAGKVQAEPIPPLRAAGLLRFLPNGLFPSDSRT